MPVLFDLMQIELARSASKTELYRFLTYIKVTAGTRDPANRTSGAQPTSVSYQCKGIVTAYTNREIDGETIQVRDRQILIFTNTLVLPSGQVPSAGDEIVGDDGSRYQVISATRDPAGAVYVVHGRG